MYGVQNVATAAVQHHLLLLHVFRHSKQIRHTARTQGAGRLVGDATGCYWSAVAVCVCVCERVQVHVLCIAAAVIRCTSGLVSPQRGGVGGGVGGRKSLRYFHIFLFSQILPPPPGKRNGPLASRRPSTTAVSTTLLYTKLLHRVVCLQSTIYDKL